MTTELHDVRPHELPPVLYVPTHPESPDGRARIAMTTLSDGRTAVFAYAALDRLLDLYDPDVPWALLSRRDLQRAYDAVPFDVLYVDQRPVVGGQR